MSKYLCKGCGIDCKCEISVDDLKPTGCLMELEHLYNPTWEKDCLHRKEQMFNGDMRCVECGKIWGKGE